MNVVARGITVVVMAVILSSCNNSSNESKEESAPPGPATPSSPAVTTSPSVSPIPAAAPFDGEVHISDDFPGESWLPTQFAPRRVPGQSVSLFNQWPLEGNTVRVLCQTEGETLRNGVGVPSSLWYGILVPTAEATPEVQDGQGAEAETVDGGYVGYVGSFWLKETAKIAPDC